ncbi:MAG TPA: hypothetical protein VG389_12975 [Myxococcota bacterium]|jgi:ABC-type nickel/cobalt efflux system permease component RcnA|nr:hypothetical protein [Myxococcota bacterium]
MSLGGLSLSALVVSAASIALLHTLAPDHWMPFAALGRAQGWSRARLCGITLVGGVGHVGSSFLLGALGLGAGWALDAVQWMQGRRGGLALYGLVGFGLLYGLWGLWRARRWRYAHPHRDGSMHAHPHERGQEHEHDHEHDHEHEHEHKHKQDHEHEHERDHEHHHEPAPEHEHRHAHDAAGAHAHAHAGAHAQGGARAHGHGHSHDLSTRRLTAWTVFVVFVLGPCEPLIPIMFAGWQHGWRGIVWPTIAFAACTFAMMVGLALLAHAGFALVRLRRLERYVHALSGATIAATGLFVLALGI